MEIIVIIVVALSVIGNYLIIRREAAKINGAAEEAAELITSTAITVSKQLEEKAALVAERLENGKAR